MANDHLRDYITNENYYEISQYLMRKETIVSKGCLILAIFLKTSGVLRLLLTKDNVDPNPILVEAAGTGNVDIMTALLEDKRTIFIKGNCESLIAASSHNKSDIVSLLLADKRFNDSLHKYAVIAIKHNALETLRIFCSDERFDPSENDCESLIEACIIRNIDIINTILLHPKCKVFGCEVLIAASNTFNIDIFKAILNSYGKKKLSCKVIVENLKPGKGEMFKAIIMKVDDLSLEKILIHCIKNNHLCSMISICNLRRLTLDANILITCLETSSTDKALLKILENYDVSPCKGEGDTCSIKKAIQLGQSESAVCLMTVKKTKDNLTFICTHASELLYMSVSNRCTSAAMLLLSHQENLSNQLIDAIILSQNETLVDDISKRLTSIDSEKIATCISKGHLRIVAIISTNINLDLTWNNYKLLRMAANDKTDKTYKVLGL